MIRGGENVTIGDIMPLKRPVSRPDSPFYKAARSVSDTVSGVLDRFAGIFKWAKERRDVVEKRRSDAIAERCRAYSAAGGYQEYVLRCAAESIELPRFRQLDPLWRHDLAARHRGDYSFNSVVLMFALPAPLLLFPLSLFMMFAAGNQWGLLSLVGYFVMRAVSGRVYSDEVAVCMELGVEFRD